jgi:ankyrin repeat protein
MILSDADAPSAPPKSSRWPFVLGLSGMLLAAGFGALVWFQEPLFHRALERSEVRQVEWWLRFNHALANEPDAQGDYPLWKAVRHPRSESQEALAQILLRAGALPNGAPSAGQPPLGGAIISGSANLVRMLLETGADYHSLYPMQISQQDRDLVTLLMSQKFRGSFQNKVNEAIFEHYIKKKSDAQFSSAFFAALAVNEDSVKWINKLLEMKAIDFASTNGLQLAYILAFEANNSTDSKRLEAQDTLKTLAAKGFDFPSIASREDQYGLIAARLREAGLEHLLDAHKNKTPAPENLSDAGAK